MIVYWFGTWLVILAAIIVLFGATTPFSRLRARRRRRHIEQTRTIGELSHGKLKDMLVQHYESSGVSGLRQFRKLIREPERIKWVVQPGSWIVSDGDQLDNWATEKRILEIERRAIGSSPLVDILMRAGILERGNDNNAIIDTAFIEAIDNLLAELEN